MRGERLGCQLFSVVYFSRGKGGERALLADLVEKLPMASLTGDQREIGKPIILSTRAWPVRVLAAGLGALATPRFAA